MCEVFDGRSAAWNNSIAAPRNLDIEYPLWTERPERIEGLSRLYETLVAGVLWVQSYLRQHAYSLQ